MSRAMVIYIYVVLAFFKCASASLLSRAETDIARPTDFRLDPDPHEALDSRLSIIDKTDKVLESYKNARNRSPCHTMASAALEYSCSTLENPMQLQKGDSKPGADEIISNNIKSYAASLAICELQEAAAKVPKACHACIPDKNTKSRPSQRNLDECVAALKSEPQSWTSYSNSKQNVFYICHALSASVRKDETLDIIEEFVKNAGELGDQLLYAPQQAQVLFNEVKTNIMRFWTELQHHNEIRRQEVDEHWTQLKGGMETDLSKIIRQFRNELQQLQTQGNQEIQEQWSRAQDTFNKASDRVTALVTKQEESAYGQVELYEYAVSLFQQGVIQAMGNATRGLALQNELVESSYQSLLKFGVALANMALAVDGVEARMEALETGMRAIHSETEKKFAELHSKANQTEDTLDRVIAKTVGLQEVVESVIQFFSMGWFDGVGTLTTFVGLNIVYALLLYGLWERWAGFSLVSSIFAATASAFTLSFATLEYIAPAYRYLHNYVSERLALPIEIDHQFTVNIGLCAFLVCLCGGVYYSRRRRHRSAPYDPASPPISKWTVQDKSRRNEGGDCHKSTVRRTSYSCS